MMGKPVRVEELSHQQVQVLLEMGLDGDAGSPDDTPVELVARAAQDPTNARLKMLIADLRQPLLLDDFGPASFSRLADVPHGDSVDLDGRSFVKLLTSSRTSSESLQCLAKYGQCLCATGLPESTRLSGACIRALALISLMRNHAVQLEDAERQDAIAFVQLLGTANAVPKALREYIQDCLSCLK